MEEVPGPDTLDGDDPLEDLLSGETGTAPPDIAGRLFERIATAPYRFGFFQLLRLIEAAHPDKPRLGESLRAGDDPVRLGQEPSLAFAPSTVTGLVFSSTGGPPRVEQRALGLFGPNAPLPIHLTEYARHRLFNDDDPTLARFVDVFHHRMLCLFYRAWANTQPAVLADRGHDEFAEYVGALFGVGQSTLHSRDALPDDARLNRAGRFALQTRPAEGLRDVVADYFEVEVRLREFMGEWLTLPRETRWLLGRPGDIGTLGIGTTIGESVWACQYRFRIVLGPLRYEDFRRFLPGGPSLERLAALVRFYAGDSLAWDLQLVLLKDEIPPLVLGRSGELGQTAWLYAEHRYTDASDAILEPQPELNQAREPGQAAAAA